MLIGTQFIKRATLWFVCHQCYKMSQNIVFAKAPALRDGDNALPQLVRKGSLTGHLAPAKGQTSLSSAYLAGPLSH